MKKTLLITGSTGFLGSNLIKKLIKKKYFIICLVRNKSNFKNVKNFTKYRYIKFFNYEKKDLRKVFLDYRIDGVLHCATNYGLNITSPQEIIDSNLIFPLKILELAAKSGVKFFINSDTILNKNISEYTLSKDQFNQWLKLYSKKIKCCNVKLEHFYGPGDNKTKFVINLILCFLSRKKNIDFTPGNQKRDFIYIDDVVEAFIKILDFTFYKNFDYKEFEVGTQKYLQLKKFVRLVKKLSKNCETNLNFGALKYRKNEKMNINVNTKSLKKTGWRPKVSLRQGLLKTIKYYEK
jgi:nucleoside-diphosphate-sugar epimerase